MSIQKRKRETDLLKNKFELCSVGEPHRRVVLTRNEFYDILDFITENFDWINSEHADYKYLPSGFDKLQEVL